MFVYGGFSDSFWGEGESTMETERNKNLSGLLIIIILDCLKKREEMGLERFRNIDVLESRVIASNFDLG